MPSRSIVEYMQLLQQDVIGTNAFLRSGQGRIQHFRFLRCLFKAATTINAAACGFLAQSILNILTLNTDKQARLTSALPLDAWN